MMKRKSATAGTAPAVVSPEPAAASAAAAPAETAPIQPETDPEPAVASAAAAPAETAPIQTETDPEALFAEALVVRSVGAKGRWRAGRFFTQEATEIPAGTRTMEQAASIGADPELIAAISD